MDEMSLRPLGGRGNLAPHPTTVVRVPKLIKQSVERLAIEARASDLDTHKEMVELIVKYANKSTGSRDWTQFDRFMDELNSFVKLT